MSAEPLTRLSRWFAAQCDGEWEHHRGISLTSTDNPGWWIKIDLAATGLAARSFAPVREGIGPDGHPASVRWLHCHVQDNVWHGTGDETRLQQIIETFLAWAESTRPSPG